MRFLAHFLQLLRAQASPCDMLLSSTIDNRPLFLDSIICLCAAVTGSTSSAGAPRDLKLNEYGKTLYFNAGVDISAAISVYVEFTDPVGKTVEVLATVGDIDVTGEDMYCNVVTFTADQYAYLVVPESLLDVAGRWTYKLRAPTANTDIPGECGFFYVVD